MNTDKQANDKISMELLGLSNKMECLERYAASKGAGARLLNKLSKISEMMTTVSASLSSTLDAAKFKEIYARALRLEKSSGWSFVTVKSARIVASELFGIPVSEFDAYLRYAIENHPEVVEIGRGMSEGLTEDDALTYKTAFGEDQAFYFALKKERCT